MVPARVWLVELEVSLVQECTVVAPDMVLPEAAAAAADGNLHFFFSCIWKM